MAGMEIAALIAAVAFAALVAFLVPTLLQVRATTQELAHMLGRLNTELPVLLAEVRTTIQNVNSLTDEAKNGMGHAAALLHAVGEVGDTVHQVHSLVRGSGGSMLGNLMSMVAGVKAASAVVKERFHSQGGCCNGG
ncbi:hypothetical protein YTPLAS18_24710 [Nitrospira sp.]|nr:hypothetical protein YTPLAS18_24710 [Nitrospira sp.]